MIQCDQISRMKTKHYLSIRKQKIQLKLKKLRQIEFTQQSTPIYQQLQIYFEDLCHDDQVVENLKKIANISYHFQLDSIVLQKKNWVRKLYQLQNDKYQTRQLYGMVTDILVNLSISSKLELQYNCLNYSFLQGDQYQIIQNLLKCIGNQLLVSYNHQLLYGLINKIHIYPLLVRIINDPHLRNNQTVSWFTITILSNTIRFRYQHYDTAAFNQVASAFLFKLEKQLQQRKDLSHTFMQLRIVMTCQVRPSSAILLILEDMLRDGHCELYLDLIKVFNAIVYHIQYYLPKKVLQKLLKDIFDFDHPQHSTLFFQLLLLNNHLINQQSSTICILRAFKSQLNDEFKQSSPLTHRLLYLMNYCSSIDADDVLKEIIKLLKNIICYEGQLGILQSCIRDLLKFEAVEQLMISLGFDISFDNGDDQL